MRTSSLFILGIIANTICFTLPGCTAQETKQAKSSNDIQSAEEDILYHNDIIQVGAERLHLYLPQIQDKKVGLVVNPTSMIGESHLVDTLVWLGIDVVRIFAPEHGFRGIADAGEMIKDGIDVRTGLPIISVYGKNKKPATNHLQDLDVILFDIQDVGARFYTYISTMHYVMEAAAENNISVIVLDRPNPNGHYVAGPVLMTSHHSFVGMHTVPIVHGMTVGEYAQMINGEGWLKDSIVCDLTVVPCLDYDHSLFYELPVKPSPNLPNMHAIYLYPALCLFEGTDISVGRGTDKQFQIIGSPGFSQNDLPYTFTPESKPGAKYPKHEGLQCFGWDFSDEDVRLLRTSNKAPGIYKMVYEQSEVNNDFFIDFFDKLAGGVELRQGIIDGLSPSELQAIYSKGLEDFKLVRKKYLLYPDFNE